MPVQPRRKVTAVKAHPRRVRVSKKNPTGVTIVDPHLRRLPGSDMGVGELERVFKSYDLEVLAFPTGGKLKKFKRADLYDDLIAVWTDYFNKKFNAQPRLDPDVVKALIASESGFDPDPPGNKIALGIAQITKQTLKVLQDPKGEAKEFIFKGIRQKDLKTPQVAIPLAVRWLFRKNKTAAGKLGRPPTSEELILEYKGLLRSKSGYQKKALENFQKIYAALKNS